MKTLTRYLPLALILILPAITWGQSSTFKLDSNSKIVVKGTSTLHDWEADVQEINMRMTLNPQALKADSGAGNGVESFSLKLPVESMESGKGKMNRKMYDALKKDDYPNITFDLQSAEPVAGGSSELNVTGDLMIAGTTKTVSFPVAFSQVNVDSYLFKGSYSLNMKDYEVDPPSAILGTIRTGEKVEILFNLIVQKAQ